jgi:integrase
MSIYSKKRKDGSTAWYYDFMYNGVRYRGVGGTTKTQALRVQERKRSEVLDVDNGLANKVRNPKIETFAETYLQRRKHMRSQKRDDLSARTLLRYFRGQNLMSILPSDIEDYKGIRMKDGVSNSTINRELTCFKRMYSLANKWGDAKNNPVKEVNFLEEPPGRTRFLSQEEAQKVIQNASKHLQPVIITALNTGMRLGEILSLKWNQVYIDNAIEPYLELTITKNNRKRFIPLNRDMVDLLKHLEVMDKAESEYVFLGRQKKPLKCIKNPFGNAIKKAEIKDFRFHDLRHTFASHYVMSGGDLISLKEILGHSTLKMVERYSHLASAYRTKMINNLNGKFKNCHLFATSKSPEEYDRFERKKEAS